MMIREKTVLKEFIERRRFCDVCGDGINITMACSKAKCEYCKKDLCEKCIGHEESSCGDYREVYCQRCWDIGNAYRPTIEEAEAKIDEMYAKWRELCVAKRG